jgi:beta-galactosidase
LSDADPKKNFIYQSGALDLVGLNYHQEVYADFQKNYPGQNLLVPKICRHWQPRGHYDMPSDSIRRWPKDGKTPLKDGNPDFTVSAYDNVSAYWGSTHEETWKIIKKYDFLSGLFVWTGFDYIRRTRTPYLWPARSSYLVLLTWLASPKMFTTCTRASGRISLYCTCCRTGTGNPAKRLMFGPIIIMPMR